MKVLPGKYKNIGPFMQIFPFEIFSRSGERFEGSTLGDPTPFIDFSRERFGMKLGLTKTLFIPLLSKICDGLIFGLFSKTYDFVKLLLCSFPGLEDTEYGEKLSPRE